ncbi:MAG TPA: transcription termination factor NusA, partial [Thermoguttaceae bacterium]|nr:transcription termination factor NusA [Thermoguttaceae bacterium]
MDPSELLRIVDTIHRDKNIDKEIVFEGIEAALVSAAKKHFGEDEEIVVQIDRANGSISGTHNGEPLSPEEMAERIGAQTAKQVMIQKIREAERDSLFNKYEELRGQLMTGQIQRYEGGAATVTLPDVEAILPRGEQIPGETHHANERVRATVYEVRKAGSRVKVILTRTKPQLVQRLFEQEIPEIAEGVIEIRAIAREPGYRTKVAVSSTDQRVDCVGACVGVRGNRIKNIVDELAGERIDIVRYSGDMQLLIPNALQPAEVEEVILCQMLGRAIVLVREDQLSLAIGRRGQNVRLASKLCGWDIEIMTRDELDDQIEQAVVGFASLEGVEDELAEKLVGEGFLSYDDLSVIEPEALMEMGDLGPADVEAIVQKAEEKAEAAEQAAIAQRRQQREQDQREAAEAQQAAEQAGEEAAEQTGEEAAEQAGEEAAEQTGEEAAEQTGEEAAEQAGEEAAEQTGEEAAEQAGEEAAEQAGEEAAEQTGEEAAEQAGEEAAEQT